MDKKISLKEIIVPPKDEGYELYRAIKTFCIIMIIFCMAIVFRTCYLDMLNNSRFLKFYPKTTVFYQDFTDIGEFRELQLSEEYQSLGYGIFKDDRGKDRFLLVAKTPDSDTPIIDTPEYSMFTKDGHTFLSDSPEELEKLLERIKHSRYEFLQDNNVKKLVKNLDENRDYTILIADADYIGLPLDAEIKTVLNKILDKTIIQVYKTENGVDVKGEITFKNKVVSIASKAKHLTESFAFRKIKVEKFSDEKPVVVFGVKDFDLWTKTFMQVAKSLPKNQYSATLALIQNDFNSDVEVDIIEKLNGNAIFYLFNDKEVLHPMLFLETKQNLVAQVKKYFNFLQLQNSSTITEKEVDDRTFNILSSAIYPYNFSFGEYENRSFIVGHQNIVENYVENKNKEVFPINSDFYLYADVKKLPILTKNDGFWTGYNTVELKLSLAPDVKFAGSLLKQE